jgi:hypothetical protein
MSSRVSVFLAACLALAPARNVSAQLAPDETDARVRSAEILLAAARADAAAAHARAQAARPGIAAAEMPAGAFHPAQPAPPAKTPPRPFAPPFQSASTRPAAATDAGLVDRSPFLPAGLAGDPARTGPLYELRGIMSSSGGTRYYIYDLSKRSGAWVGLNETGYPFEVSLADSSLDTVTLDVAGFGPLPLTLHESEVLPMGGAPRTGWAVTSGGYNPADSSPGSPALQMSGLGRNPLTFGNSRAMAPGEAQQAGPGVVMQADGAVAYRDGRQPPSVSQSTLDRIAVEDARRNSLRIELSQTGGSQP